MSYLDQITVGSTTYDIKDSDAQRKTIEGAGAPSSGVTAEVGTHYFDTTASSAPYEYICTAASNGSYTWMPAGYGAQGAQGSSGVYYGSGTPPSGTNVWIDITGDADGVIPAGGSAGQVLIKNSNNNYDVGWGDVGGGSGAVLSVNSKTGIVVLGADDVGAIALPTSASSGDFLMYNGTAWVAASLSVWQGGNY